MGSLKFTEKLGKNLFSVEYHTKYLKGAYVKIGT